MTSSAHHLLNAFDALAPNEQQSVAIEILRRSVATEEMSDEAFNVLAAEVFQTYDAEETNGAGS